MSRARVFTTAEQVLQMQRVYTQLRSARKTAVRFDCNEATIRLTLKRYGYPVQRRGRVK